MGDVTQVATEAIQGYREVRTFGGEAYEQDRFHAVSERNRRPVHENGTDFSGCNPCYSVTGFSCASHARLDAAGAGYPRRYVDR